MPNNDTRKKTNVIPKDMLKNFSLPSCKPTAEIIAIKIILCIIDGFRRMSNNQSINR